MITLERIGNIWTISLPNGARVSGDLDWLAADIDARLLRDAVTQEREAVVIPGSTVVTPEGKRLVLLARRAAIKTAAIVGLLGSGWRVEGNALIFVRRDGFTAYPQAIRIDAEASRLINPSIDVHLSRPVESFDGRWRALSPDAFGQRWIIEEAPASAVLFLDLNPGGCIINIKGIDSQKAFTTALNSVTGKPTAAALSALMEHVSACPSYQLCVGNRGSLKTALMRIGDLI